MDTSATLNLNVDATTTAFNNMTFFCDGPCWNFSDVSPSALTYFIHKFEPTGYSLLNYAPYRLWFLVLDFTLLVPTLFGNILILVALVRYKLLRKIKGFILIGNLAISDLLVGVIFLPMDISLHVMDNLIENGTYCICYYSVLYTLLTASVLNPAGIWCQNDVVLTSMRRDDVASTLIRRHFHTKCPLGNLLLLSVERYYAIIRPYRHGTRFTTQRLCILICTTWIMVVIVGFLPVFGWRPYLVENDRLCGRSILFSSSYQTIMNIIIIVALIVCFVCFIAVIRVALRKAHATKRNNVSDSGSSLKREIDYTKVLLIVSGLFIVCWGPFCVLSLFPNYSLTMLYIKNFLASLGLVNSCLNWIVYGAKNRKFRAAFKDILIHSYRKSDVMSSSS